MSSVSKPSVISDALLLDSTPSLTAEPGALRGGASMVIHTRQARSLVQGRRELNSGARIGRFAGLLDFGKQVRLVWNAVEMDDPWADWGLIKIASALARARSEIEADQQRVGELVNARRGIKLQLGESSAPVEVPLTFANPYGYQGAYLVADYDNLVVTVLTAKYLALLKPSQGTQIIERTAHYIRSAFAVPFWWKNCGVGRADARYKTQRAVLAESKMGALPEEILEMTVRAEYAPSVKSKTKVRRRDETPLVKVAIKSASLRPIDS